MQQNRKRIFWLSLIVVLAVVSSFLIVNDEEASGKTYVVKNGDLEAVVECIGEVNGENASEINIPASIRDRQLRIWGIKIMDMVEEGKIVKKGDFIAQLDQTEISNNMRQKMKEKETVDADLKNAKIDSTVILNQKREEIANARLDLEYKKIDLELSVYESGAFQRKTKMDYQKTELQLEKKRRDYLLEQNKLKVKVMRLERKADNLNELIAKYRKALMDTRVKTSQDGIVMLGKNWDGKKYSKDDHISTWRPLIATLPDMSVAISETFVKEIDVSKVNVGDSVSIKIDALSEKKFSGKVVKVAAIGEDHPAYDMKVFKVIVRFNESDEELRPGMTSTNNIIVDRFENQPLIPVNAVFPDSLNSVVYVKQGGKVVKQAVELGSENEDMVVVLSGLQEGDKILLNQPDEYQKTASL